MMRREQPTPGWIQGTLVAAAIYNIVWGALVILFPAALFAWAGMAQPLYPSIWQCVGMMVGVYGIAYWLAARNPYALWPIVLVGFLGKVFGPIGFLYSAVRGDLPWIWGLTIITNDLIWWIPFAAILYHVCRQHMDYGAVSQRRRLSFNEAIQQCRSHRGSSLAELSRERPTLVVFLRHTGCTFCREAIDDMARQRSEIEAQGVQMAVVHMSHPMQATRIFCNADLDDVHRFSDPECVLYDAFRIERGSLGQLLGPTVWRRGCVAAILKGHGMGAVSGDGFRMPGVFLLKNGRIAAEYRAQIASDRPDYVELATQHSNATSGELAGV